jgi:hypothetical protein
MDCWRLRQGQAFANRAGLLLLAIVIILVQQSALTI